ncbi:Mov34/MPN/PAD-1 family protein [uncultured Piscinibacter sp.]|uniref:Mov34/MPN/PAD-1 family protein n=1 Tax=uncultured Piscinibacter sp. TaxID=1131835 RepID=UPI00262C02FE|nr:Mov34/MPN/PAD-1 family protein [uncultured Piscinibacter sp.]
MKQAVTFQLPGASWTLELSDSVLAVLGANAQFGRRDPESVGQLFVRDLTQAEVVVELATVLKPTLARRTRVKFDVAAAQSERDRLFEKGWHCIGIWHSHPEPFPSPSDEDHELASDHARAAQGQLSGLTFAIVGTSPLPAGLGVWVHDGQDMHGMVLLDSASVKPPAR